MKPSFISKCAVALCIPFIAISCNKNIEQQQPGCDLVMLATVIPFNVLDASTGQDLFFSSSPRYQTSSLYFFSIKDKTRKDTIRPAVVETGAGGVFTIPFNYNVPQDTLLMKVATNPDDVIIYTRKKGTDACAAYMLDKVFFNGTQITSNQGKFNFTK
ncbi:MAG: hypothetical protein JWR09_4790 [Mucilaginibacter sp.]|nr:hypothetical protein [Mucilaginibacter sp.]